MNSTDFHQLLRLLFAFALVMAMMGLLGLFLRRINERRILPGGKKRRLSIVETLPIDGRRRLVLLRRDNVEHLVILGTNTETLIERRIESGQDGALPEEPICPTPPL
jgi:flagellar protein FliO/FliZ